MDVAALSEKEALEELNRFTALQKERNALETRFMEAMRQTISAKKTLLLIQAEKDFKRELFAQFRKRRKQK